MSDGRNKEIAELAQEIAAEEGLPLEEATAKAERELNDLMWLATGQWAEAIDPDHLGHILSLSLQVIEEAHPALAHQLGTGAVYNAAEGLRHYLRLLGWMDTEAEEQADRARQLTSPAQVHDDYYGYAALSDALDHETPALLVMSA